MAALRSCWFCLVLVLLSIWTLEANENHNNNHDDDEEEEVALLRDNQEFVHAEELYFNSTATDESVNHRSLQSVRSQICLKNVKFSSDAAWYEIEITITSVVEIRCAKGAWEHLRKEIREAINRANLFNTRLRIVGMNVQICNERAGGGGRMRRALVDRNDPTKILRYLDDNVTEQELQQHRKLGLVKFVFHLYFRGGGKCVFCSDDNKDAGGRRQLQFLPNDEAIQNETVRDANDNEELHASTATASFTGLRGAFHDDNIAENATAAVVVPDQIDDFVNNDWTLDQRRRLGCGGCHKIDFERDGKNRRITGTPYLQSDEYWQSKGVKIKAYPKYGGYAPNNKARIFDSSNPGPDPDLGSPNQHCPSGGPGRGEGGQPQRRGRYNPGKNCRHEGKILIIQTSQSSTANDHNRGGKIVFDFRYPVKLRKIGLMDFAEWSGEWIEVKTKDGRVQKHRFKGYGENSIEEVQLNRNDVVKLTVNFPGSGAIRYIDFCHNCGTHDRERQKNVDHYYPAPRSRHYENKASVLRFLEMIPDLNRALVRIVGGVVRRYTSNRHHCLFQKSPSVAVKVLVSSPVGAMNCRDLF